MAKTTTNKRAPAASTAPRDNKKPRLEDDAIGPDASGVAENPEGNTAGTDDVPDTATPSSWSSSTLDEAIDTNVITTAPAQALDAAPSGADIVAAADVADEVADDVAAPVYGPATDPNAVISPDVPVDDHHPKFEGLLYVPIEDLERACGFATKNDPANRRYALNEIPSDARWGTSSSTERYLTDERNNVLTAWVIGRVRSKWFFNMWGEAQNRVNIAVTLPYKADTPALHRVFQRARPKKEDAPTVVYASRFQTKQAKGELEATITPFRNIYDARERFRAKANMPLLDASQLGRGDLVLVEVFVNRYKTAKDKKNRKTWTLWDVGLELQSVSLLFEAPAGLDEEDIPTVDDNIEDDM